MDVHNGKIFYLKIKYRTGSVSIVKENNTNSLSTMDVYRQNATTPN